MKIVYVSCVEIGYTVLQNLILSDYSIELIITLDKKVAGMTSGFVDFVPIAYQSGIPLLEVRDINSIEIIPTLLDISPDLLIVCGWQQLLKKELLEIPLLGCIGFHTSLLPKYRGHAPVNWAIILGEKETGVTVFFMDEGADSGDILGQIAFPITLEDDCNTIYKKSAQAAGQLLFKILDQIENNSIQRVHNTSRSFPTYPRRRPQDGLIDFERNTIDVYNWIRALTKPYPGSFFYQHGKKIIVWKSRMNMIEKNEHYIFKKTLDGVIAIIQWEASKL